MDSICGVFSFEAGSGTAGVYNGAINQSMGILFAVDVEHSHVRFLGNLVLNLWDCGG